MNRVTRSSADYARAGLLLGLPLLIIAMVASVLPWSGHALSTAAVVAGNDLVLRFVVLLLSYGLAGIAAYRRSGDAVAGTVAILLGAALGWAGWEWQSISIWLPLFSALVLVLTWPGERPALVAGGLVLVWALVDSSATWGALFLLGTAAGGARADARRRLLLACGGLAAATLLEVRGVDLGAVLLPAARPWVWVDGQAQTTFADPIGLALFALVLALLGLKFLRPARTPAGLAVLGVLGYLAWHTRSNGIWLSLAAVPVLADALSGTWLDAMLPARVVRSAILGAATFVGISLLFLASTLGPGLIGGTRLPADALSALPGSGLLMYRPAFEPTLLRVRARETLALARPSDSSGYRVWERIAADCDPATELARLQAEAAVLDPQQDAAVIATLQSDGWRTAWSGASAVVLSRPGASQ